MKKALALITALGLAVGLSVSAMAADLTEDRNTHGEWVGTYGKDGYIIFNPAVEEPVTRETLPEYVTEFTYTDLYEGEAPRHSWWSGTAEDAANITEVYGGLPVFEDALWTDETKTSRTANAIYNGDGVMITLDTGDVTTTVSLYSLDWDYNGRVMLVTLYDADGNELVNKEVADFQKGVWLSTEVTGKVVIEYVYLDATNMDSPSNAVVAGVFFDSAAGVAEEAPVVEEPVIEEVVEEPAVEEVVEEPVVEEPVVEEPVVEEPVVEEVVIETPAAAPQTFDIAAVLAVLTGVLGMGLTVINKRR